MPAFLDEVLAPPFVDAPKAKDKYAFGQIFTVPAYYPHQRVEIWRPEDVNPKLGTASNFNIKSGVKDAFARSLALTNPHLATNEEFVALRAKKRPVVLIQPPDPELLNISKGPFAGQIVRNLATVCLFYSTENVVGDAKFNPELIDRVRRLEYRQFMFVRKGGPLELDSLLRLDCVQSVAEAQLEPSGYSLSEDLCAVLRSQLAFYQTGLAADEFAGWAALLHD
jgi:hypothetical protein